MQNINNSFPTINGIEQPSLFQPILEDDLILIRPIIADDFDGLYAIAADPLLWEQHPVKDRYKIEVFRPLFEEALASKGGLTIIDKMNNRIIGSSRYYRWNQSERSLEIGWTFIARDCWGGVYNSAVKRLMIHHAFTFAEAIYFLVGANNFRSQKAVLKLGAKQVPVPINVERPTVAFCLFKHSNAVFTYL